MQKLIIKNFRQIPYAEIDIKKFTIFIGPQASGKSTIAKLVYFFKSLPNNFYTAVPTSTYIKEGKYFEFYIEYIEEKFEKMFLKSKHSDFQISFTYDIGKTVYVNFNSNKFSMSFEKGFEQLLKEKLEFYCSEFKNVNFQVQEAKKLLEIELSKRIFFSFLDQVKDEATGIFSQLLYVGFIPSSRKLTIRRPYFLKDDFEKQIELDQEEIYDDLFLLSFFQYAAHFSEYFYQNNPLEKDKKSGYEMFYSENIEKILRAKISIIDSKEFFTNGKFKTSINEGSTGQQEILRILQGLYYFTMKNEQAFQIFEEPEAHLFPEAQKHLIELMALMANKTNSQVLITTHSPYILTIINNLLFYNQTIQRNPEAAEIIKKHFGTENLDEAQNERIYLSPDEVRVYSLGKDKVEQIIDPDTGLIGANFLDQVAEDMYQDFDFMYPLNRKEEA